MNKIFIKALFRFFPLLFALVIFISCSEEKEKTETKSIPDTSTVNKKEGKIKVNGAEIYYKRMGSGEPLIIVHGGPGLDHTYMLPQLKSLAGNFELIFFDERGSGKSFDNLDTTKFNLKNMVKDIELLRNRLNLDKVNILGHSWGAFLAMKYAIDNSRFIKSLILVDPFSPLADVRAKEDSILNSRKSPDEDKEIEKIKSSEEFKNKDPKAYEKLFRVMFRKEFYNKNYPDSLYLHFPEHFAQGMDYLQMLWRNPSEFDIENN